MHGFGLVMDGFVYLHLATNSANASRMICRTRIGLKKLDELLVYPYPEN
jgi:hypothetical protein